MTDMNTLTVRPLDLDPARARVISVNPVPLEAPVPCPADTVLSTSSAEAMDVESLGLRLCIDPDLLRIASSTFPAEPADVREFVGAHADHDLGGWDRLTRASRDRWLRENPY